MRWNEGHLPSGKRVLTLLCNPTHEEANLPAISAEGKALQDHGLIGGGDVVIGGTFPTLKKALEEFKPHIFWFAGHGDASMPTGYQCTLGWTTEAGGLQLIEPPDVCNTLLASFDLEGRGTQRIFLSSRGGTPMSAPPFAQRQHFKPSRPS